MMVSLRPGPHVACVVLLVVVVVFSQLATNNNHQKCAAADAAELVAPAFPAAQLSAEIANDWPSGVEEDEEKTIQVIGDNHEPSNGRRQRRRGGGGDDKQADDLRAHGRSLIDDLSESNSLIERQDHRASECSEHKCAPPLNSATGDLVCASNGRTYRSMCELRQVACQSGHSHRLHAVKCERSSTELDDDELTGTSSCTRHDYRDFKLALWRQFHQDTRALFKYLDTNSNGRVEARELWPRLRRPQLDRVSSTRELTLEPHYAWNPCALAHLMSFELTSEGDTLTLDHFKRAFDVELTLTDSKQQQLITSNSETTDLQLELGESRLLSCLTPSLKAQLESTKSSSSSPSPDHKLDCLWTRLGVNLGAIQDEHIQLSARNSSTHMRALYLRDAQLYLSGTFECTCRVANLSSFAHKYSLMVTAKPRVSVRPEFQWSPANSRASFECQHDFVDTSASGAWSSTSGGESTSIEWLKQSLATGSGDDDDNDNVWQVISTSGSNYTLTSGQTRLNLEQIQSIADSADYKCRFTAAGSSAETSGRLLVRDQQPAESDQQSASVRKKHLWMFHGGGISVYELRNKEELELDLVRELRGQTEVSGEVDGNWNQLTLCGGVGVEQAVICEWSDNAIEISVGDYDDKSRPSYIYVGQPNLARLIVLDARELAIVALVSTAPQPRKLFAYEPNKIHLNKWLRRRLSPLANSRWLAAIARERAHPVQLSPKSSRLYSQQREREQERQQDEDKKSVGDRARRHAEGLAQLVQRDIWLLCYGQPLVPTLDPARETFDSTTSENLGSSPPRAWPLVEPAHWADEESRLRNRKSVQIIQSTFFATTKRWPQHRHTHQRHEIPATPTQQAINEFKRLTVLTTHYVTPSLSVNSNGNGNNNNNNVPTHEYPHQWGSGGASSASAELVQDLSVPMRPRALAATSEQARAELHYAYATHFNERHLYRIAMDTYHYDRAIDLTPTHCDPVSLTPTVQGLLIIQCRSPITRQLTGQLVLDELTSAQLELNAQIRAQSAYLSPDSRYLISVFSPPQSNQNATATTIIYVQLITISGLKFQYEIKTALDIGQCAFVWRDGYYVAVFVAQNKRDRQTELLSLRLADSRLELMVRVPGLVNSSTRHREPLNILSDLKIAALTTNEATHIVDLAQNRVTQTLAEHLHHQSSPTLLWV